MSEVEPEGWAFPLLSEVLLPSRQRAEPGKANGAVYLGLEHIESATNRILGYENSSGVRSTTNVFRQGDVLYGKLRPYLNKVAVPQFDGVCSTEIIVFPQQAWLDSRLLMWFLSRQEVVQHAEHNSSGTQLPRVNFEALGELPLPVPPQAEQVRIVDKITALLDRVNVARDRLAKVPAILKRFRQSVLASASSGRLTERWRAHRSGLAIGSDPRDAEAAPGWRSVRVADVVECLDHLRRPVNKDDRSKRSGDIPYYGANGQVGWIDTPLFDEDLVLVVEDETFIGREKPFSYVIRGKSWVNNHAHVLRPLNGMSADYLNSVLSFYDFVPLTSGTTGRRKLTKSALMDAPLFVAPLDEQREIVRRLDALFTLTDAIERRVASAAARADKLTQAILAKAFRGELVPTEAELARQEGREYEPAAVLLERIRAERAASADEAPNRKRRAAKAPKERAAPKARRRARG